MEKAKGQCQDIPEEEKVGGICLFTYSKSPSYEHSSCELSKMRTRVPSGSGWVQLQPAPSPRADVAQPRCLPPPLPPLVSNASCLLVLAPGC